MYTVYAELNQANNYGKAVIHMAKNKKSPLVTYSAENNETAHAKHSKATTLTVDVNRLVNDLVDRCVLEATRRAAAEARLALMEPRGREAVEVEFEEVGE